MSDTDASPQKLYVSATAARTFTTALLKAHGVPDENAATVAHCLVEADLRGVDTHGMNRLPSYLERIRQGVLDAAASPIVEQMTPVVAKIDGCNSFGFLSAVAGIDAGIAMARLFGLGLVSVAHSNHFGMSASFVQRAVDAGMMSVVFTNSSPALPAWGGADRLLGVSPLAAGAPAGETVPFILDMAPSVAARGKIYKALRRGETIPSDWALDADGRRTEDPAAALQGVMLPMGGPKGSGLAVMMDVFSGVLSGSAFAGGVTGPYDPSRAADVGHFILVLRPDLFMTLDEFKARMDTLYQKVVGSRRMDGCDRIYYPGEIELLCQQAREKEGIPFVQAEVDALNKEADAVGVALLQVSDTPLVAAAT